MPIRLPDSNIWVALCMERHKHHKAALRWFNAIEEADSACFCRMTQKSFLRLVTVKEFQKEDVMSNSKAVAAYRDFRNYPRCGWLHEPLDMEAMWLTFAARKSASPKVWMDAYLAAFAIHSNAQLVTFDADFKKFERHGLALLKLHNAKVAAR